MSRNLGPCPASDSESWWQWHYTENRLGFAVCLCFLFYPREEQPHCWTLKKTCNKYFSTLGHRWGENYSLLCYRMASGTTAIPSSLPPKCLSKCTSPWDPRSLYPHRLLCSPSNWWLAWFPKFLQAALLGKSLTLCLSSNRLEIYTEVYEFLNTHSISTLWALPIPLQPSRNP